MYDIWAGLAALQQPCLYRPIGDRLLDGDGLVRREVLSSLDRIFCEHLATGLASFQAPMSPPPIPATHRFLNISALQKSIRRGDAEGAMRYAQQGCFLNAEQVFRRLATCALEDVGIGNLLVVGMSLAVMGKKSLRATESQGELAAYLAYMLAVSPKSRLACDLLSICDYDRSLDPLKRKLAQAEDRELASTATDRSCPKAQRMIAAWLLAGTARFQGTTMPKILRDRHGLMRLLASKGLPLVLYYIADRAAARIADPMFVSMLMISEMLINEPIVTITKEALSDVPRIGGFPAPAFDLHTQEGRFALSQFGHQCSAVGRSLYTIEPTLRDLAIRHGVFIAEGGRLAVRVNFADADEIEKHAHSTELAFAGLNGQLQQTQFLQAISRNLSQLHRLRSKILFSSK